MDAHNFMETVYMSQDRVNRGIREGWIRVRSDEHVQLLKEDLVFENKFIRVYDDLVQFRYSKPTNFLRVTYGDGIDDGSVVVPVTGENQIVLVRQFRHSTRLWMEELPRGFAQPAAPNTMTVKLKLHEDTARRELHEETGYEISLDEIYSLGRLIPDSGKLHDAPYLVVGRAVAREYRGPDVTEAIAGLKHYTFSKLKAKCQAGEIMDMFTLAAVTRLEPHFVGDVFAPDKALLQRSERLRSLDDLNYEDYDGYQD